MGILAFAEMLENNKTLEVVDLSYNLINAKIGSIFLDKIAASFHEPIESDYYNDRFGLIQFGYSGNKFTPED